MEQAEGAEKGRSTSVASPERKGIAGACNRATAFSLSFLVSASAGVVEISATAASQGLSSIDKDYRWLHDLEGDKLYETISR